MTLRRKTLLIIGLALAGLTLLLSVTASAVLLNSFNDLEAETTQRNVERVANAIAESMTTLSVTAEDYAGWDDTYSFLADRNQEYLDNNFYNENLLDLGVNIVAFYDVEGNSVFSKAVDLNDAGEIPLPAGVDDLLAPGSTLLARGLNEGAAGIVLLDEGPMMLAARPVLPSLGDAPSRGVMLLGRYLDEQEIESLSQLTNLDIGLHRLDRGNDNPSLAGLVTTLSAENPILVQPLNSRELAGYSLLMGIEGQPALLLEVTVPRSIYQQGLASIRFLLFSLVAVALVAGAITLFLIERLVLARLARLSSDVGRIGASGQPTERVTMTGRPDELSHLADDINQMLAALEVSQNSLRESETRYRAVVEQAAEGIFLVDAQSQQILEANRAYQQMLGYTAEEITALTIYDITADDPKNVQEAMERTVQKGFYAAGERRHRRKDGTLVDVEVSASLLSSSGRQVLCTIAHDITARKRADKELQRLLRETLLLNRVIAAASTALKPQDVMRTVCQELALALHLPQASFALLNDGGRQLTVIAEYAGRNRPSALGVIIPVADHPAVQLVLANRQPLTLVDAANDPRYLAMHPITGEQGIVSLLLLPLLIRDRVAGTLELSATETRDFSAEEIELAQNVIAATSQALENAQLYAAVQQELADRKRAEADAQKARDAAEAANQAKSDFISTVSHELKVPMTTIMGYTELMARGMGGSVSEKQVSFLSIIQSSVERMTRLVGDLTDISRIESGRMRLDFSTVYIGEVVEEIVRSTQNQLDTKWQTLEVNIPSDLPPVWADRSRLVQVIANLMSNAHKYSPVSGRIKIEAECIHTQSGAVPTMEVVHVSVQDDGIGISPEDQQLLFQKFFRSGDEKAREAPGTGLGLSITKELVELQGGRIWFESEFRRGTTFHFIIPATVPR